MSNTSNRRADRKRAHRRNFWLGTLTTVVVLAVIGVVIAIGISSSPGNSSSPNAEQQKTRSCTSIASMPCSAVSIR